MRGFFGQLVFFAGLYLFLNGLAVLLVQLVKRNSFRNLLVGLMLLVIGLLLVALDIAANFGP